MTPTASPSRFSTPQPWRLSPAHSSGFAISNPNQPFLWRHSGLPSLPAVFLGGLGLETPVGSSSSPVSCPHEQDFCGHYSGFPSSSSIANAGPDASFGGTTSLSSQPTVSTSTTSIDNSSVSHGQTTPNPPKRRRTNKDSKTKKSPPFSEQETIALLDISSDAQINHLLRKPGMKRSVWETISKQMSQHGYTTSPHQCMERIRLLEKKYKMIQVTAADEKVSSANNSVSRSELPCSAFG